MTDFRKSLAVRDLFVNPQGKVSRVCQKKPWWSLRFIPVAFWGTNCFAFLICGTASLQETPATKSEPQGSRERKATTHLSGSSSQRERKFSKNKENMHLAQCGCLEKRRATCAEKQYMQESLVQHKNLSDAQKCYFLVEQLIKEEDNHY